MSPLIVHHVAANLLLQLLPNDHRALAIALGLAVGKMDAIADRSARDRSATSSAIADRSK